jgi:hypothetical protein
MESDSKLGFAHSLAGVLKKEKIPFKKNVVLGGIEADFWLRTPTGNEFVIETKEWEPTPKNKKAGIELADHFRSAMGVERGFVVIPEMKKGDPTKGLVSLNELVEILKDEFLEKKVREAVRDSKGRAKRIETAQSIRRTVFAAMPFSNAYNNTYFFAMAPAASSVGAKCVRIDKVQFSGDIVAAIDNAIRASIAVIADLSESLPNVLYEAGIAHAIKKPTIHICSTPLENLPFDVKTWNTIKYDKEQINELKPKLKRAIKAALGND